MRRARRARRCRCRRAARRSVRPIEDRQRSSEHERPEARLDRVGELPHFVAGRAAVAPVRARPGSRQRHGFLTISSSSTAVYIIADSRRVRLRRHDLAGQLVVPRSHDRRSQSRSITPRRPARCASAACRDTAQLCADGAAIRTRVRRRGSIHSAPNSATVTCAS